MEPVFPGMDPFLEAPTLWPDLHASLITSIRNAIQRQLSAKYAAVITPYIALESIEISPVRRAFIPDIGIVQNSDLSSDSATATAVAPAPAPLTALAVMPVPTRYARIEIRSVLQETLITSLEILSPANKRPGADGADAYEQKRQELFAGGVHLLEIDLLRAGQRPRFSRPLPPSPYFIFLSRAYNFPTVEVWPCPLNEALPVVPVPLAYPDPDVVLNLNQLLHEVYRQAAYERRIDYRTAPPLPELSSEEAPWLDAQLRSRGLR